MINRHSFTPIYVQIAQAVIQLVHDRALKYGEQVPSERELAEQYKVSRLTARQAIDELVKRGIAYRVQGKGTFLAHPKIREASGLMSFTDELRQRGFTPTSKVITQQVIPASEAVAARLQIEVTTPIFNLNRIRLADGQPVAMEYAYINLRLFPGIDEETFEDKSFFDLIRSKYGVYPAWAEAEIEARLVSEQEARWLDLPPKQAILVAHRMTYTEAFEPIEAVDSIYPGDRFPIYIGRQRIHYNLEEKE